MIVVKTVYYAADTVVRTYRGVYSWWYVPGIYCMHFKALLLVEKIACFSGAARG